MLTIMTTKNFLNAIDDAYAKGVCAGTMQQKLSDHEEQNRRLEDMLHRGEKIGFDDGYIKGYTKGHKVGYSEGEFDSKAKLGIIEVSAEEFDELAEE